MAELRNLQSSRHHHSVCLFREKSEVVRCPRLQVLRAIYPSLSCSSSRSSTSIHPLHPLFPNMPYFRSCHPHSVFSHVPFLIFIMLSYPSSFFFFRPKICIDGGKGYFVFHLTSFHRAFNSNNWRYKKKWGIDFKIDRRHLGWTGAEATLVKHFNNTTFSQFLNALLLLWTNCNFKLWVVEVK